MKSHPLRSIAIAVAAIVGAAGHAQAAQANFNCHNITFSGVDYDACQGSFTGNDKPAAVSVLSWDVAIGSVVSKDDDAGTAAASDLINAVAGSSGKGSVTFLQSITEPFVLTLKMGNHWAAYLFDTDVTANTTWNFAGGPRTGAGLSHITYWGSPAAPVPAVPEPQTYALLLAGLAAVGAVSRRRQRSN